MEKRRYERKPLSLKAELTIGKENYSCVIQNLSEYGAYVEVSTLRTSVEFYADTRGELKFQLPTGEKLNLNGEVRWFRADNPKPDCSVYHMGMEILTPPAELAKFLKTLQ